MSLQELKGSSAQINWAEDIRLKYIHTLKLNIKELEFELNRRRESGKTDLKDMQDENGNYDAEKDRTHRAIALMNELINTDSAVIWIDIRDHLKHGFDNIFWILARENKSLNDIKKTERSSKKELS